MKNFIILFSLILLSAGCQVAPTKVKESLTLGPNPDYSRTLNDNSVILDARPLFSFTSGHLPKAQPIRWDFFGQSQNPGLLRTDLSTMARELARLGVAPDRHVVVVGLGRGGMGEEGRVAWMLNYLGVRNVVFARESYFKMKRQSGPVVPNQNAPDWEPQVDASLVVTKKEMLESDGNPQYRIVDVRPVDDYLGRNPEAVKRPDIGAINIPWTEFIDENGLPKADMAGRLSSVGVTKDKRVVVICEQGVRSALATQVLRELGYKNAGNFAGGFKELFSEGKKTRKR